MGTVDPALSLAAAGIFERRYGTRGVYRAPIGNSEAAWPGWRARLKHRLLERLGIDLSTTPAPVAAVESEVDLGDHRRIRIVFESQPGMSVPAWILVPSGRTGPGPAVVAVHGHGNGANEVVGLASDGTPRSGPPGYQHDFAVRLAQRGFVVAAPEMLGFGMRRETSDIARGDDESSCRTLATWALMLGTTLVGQRVLDLIRTVDVLSARADVSPSAIGIFGVSGGATASLLAACLDDRLAAAVLSGYVSSFRASVLAMEHCICNVIPGIVSDLEMADLALGIAPRPLLLEAGRDDPLFPIAAALAAADTIRRGYTDVGARARFELDAFDGGHEVSGRHAFDFLDRWLGSVDSSAAGHAASDAAV